MSNPEPETGQPAKRQYRTIGDGEFGKHRVLVVYLDGIAGHVIRWTQACSGCTNYEDGQMIGSPTGCHECGYTGKRREESWIPFDYTAWDDHLKAKGISFLGK